MASENQNADTVVPSGGNGTAPPLRKWVGPYKILQKIAEGGMGVVYMAEQREPIRRRVALKVIRAGAQTSQIVARFEAERQALAMMSHTNISSIFDAGTTKEGAPYFVMELVKGVPLTEFCDENRLSVRDRLELFIPVCLAIQHAHIKGVIHRDLKPSNVLVALHDGKPVPKVIDFGLAKATEHQTLLTDRTMFTEFGQIVGTLRYMSPEQAETNQLDVDTRTDVYSLGVMLYELLTGTTPLENSTLGTEPLLKTLEHIREADPPRPSMRLSRVGDALGKVSEQRRIKPEKLRQVLRGELDWIVMKALEKDRSRRFDTPSLLADDLRRYLADEPVLARPPSAAYRLSKAYRKYRAVVLVTLAIVGLLAAGLVGTATMWQKSAVLAESNGLLAKENANRVRDVAKQRDRAMAAEKTAIAEQSLAEAVTSRSNYYLSVARWSQGRAEEARDLLARVPARHEGIETRLARREFRGSDITLYGHTDAIQSCVFSPDGKIVASASDDQTVHLWEVATGRELRTIGSHMAPVRVVRFDPNGRRLVTADDQGTVQVYELERGQNLKIVKDHKGAVLDAAVSPDGTLLASCGADSSIRLRTIAGDSVRVLTGHEGHVLSVSFSPDGRYLASSGADKSVRVWNAETGEQIWIGMDHVASVECVRFSPTGRHLASASFDNTVRLWDVGRGKVVRVLPGHLNPCRSLQFSPCGLRLVTGGDDNLVRVWDVTNGQQLFQLAGHFSSVLSVDVNTTGTRIISCGADRTLRIWDMDKFGQERVFRKHTDGITGLDFDCTGKWMLATCYDGTFSVWNVQTNRLVGRLGNGEFCLQCGRFSPDGSLMATGGDDGTLRLWCGPDRGDEYGPLKELKGHEGTIHSLAFAPGGNSLATGGADQKIRIWDVQSGTVSLQIDGHSAPVLSVCFSPDGTLLASTSEDGTLRAWEAASGREVWKASSIVASSAVFVGDGSLIASQADRSQLQLWDSKTGEVVRTLTGHYAHITSVDASPDGTRLASTSWDSTVRLWDLESGEELKTYRAFDEATTVVRFRPDNSGLAAGSYHPQIRIWDSEPIPELRVLKGRPSQPLCVAMSHDGERVVVGYQDARIEVWTTQEPEKPSATLRGHTGPLGEVGFSPDGQRIYSVAGAERFVWSVNGDRIDSAEWQPVAALRHSRDGKAAVTILGHTAAIIDSTFGSRPREKALRNFKFQPRPMWHQVQAREAASSENWFAVAFHADQAIQGGLHTADMDALLKQASEKARLAPEESGETSTK